jgi:predicted transglutaminase-like cysteine proteinase
MDERWRRVAQPDMSAAIAHIIAPVLTLTKKQQASFIQATVNRTIAYREDIENWGEADHWATASETLARRSGDCEDFAIVKMQALLQLGFDARDLYLVVGEDKARMAHAILLVRLDDRFWVLDDRVGKLVDAVEVHGFKPTITMGSGMAWLHGVEFAGHTPVAAQSR